MKAQGLILFLSGAVIGAATALLLAPESGERTRRRVKRFIEDEKDKLVDTYQDVRAKIEDQAEKIEKKIKKEAKA